MPAVVRLGDKSCGHECYPSRPNIEASDNVFVNGRGVHRLGDAWAVHGCVQCKHGGRASSGSSTVFVNSKSVCRIGDSIDCGDVMCEGSFNVFAGG